MNSPKSLAGDRISTTQVSTPKTRSLGKMVAGLWVDALSLVVIVIIFVIPFIFIVLTASKTRQQAGLFEFNLPTTFRLFENIRDVITFGDNRMLLALWNSALLTVGSIALIVLLAAMV